MTLREIKEGLEKTNFKIFMYQLRHSDKVEFHAKLTDDMLSKRVRSWRIARYGGDGRTVILHAHVK